MADISKISVPISGTSTELNIKDSDARQSLNSKVNLVVIASTFSSSQSYAVGEYVIYDGNFYKCTAAHTAGAWNSDHFTQTDLSSELKTKQDKIFVGTTEAWTNEQHKEKYELVDLTDDQGSSTVIGTAATKDYTTTISGGNADLPTSGAVYMALSDKANTSSLGTAAAKNSTNAVTQSSTDLVESGAVYNALSNIGTKLYRHDIKFRLCTPEELDHTGTAFGFGYEKYYIGIKKIGLNNQWESAYNDDLYIGVKDSYDSSKLDRDSKKFFNFSILSPVNSLITSIDGLITYINVRLFLLLPNNTETANTTGYIDCIMKNGSKFTMHIIKPSTVQDGDPDDFREYYINLDSRYFSHFTDTVTEWKAP